ncbi:TonB-linked SusC/RagA family outer membrane protein [Aquimarina sp. MAR_2010_214]|uniref:SusC/RagA family TonB-linked outer membrane protein n=1 Tax=Aquimarina sp. MAR_2010_214 TaxID=1250026 RepID=UPI000C6FD3C8|nr:SusC/RagA family TonB-linked outer membrane protein [Aquimarina sp. MAR_2010_214]PKV50163.1 TonB-linked SusC/RagA family outer membrane protein [Aquimarina sp. MAR_2010_214]
MVSKLLIFLTFVLCLFSSVTLAQNKKTVSGIVTGEDGMPLVGVNVIEKGTSNGTSTDFDGNYTVEVSDLSGILIFSSLGFEEKEISINGQSEIKVSLIEDTEQLGEVVVTALGIKRARKSLGYSVQEVKGTTVLEARENNLANSISGKVAGLQIVRGSNGPAGSSKIVLRGNNSLTGDNQPLIVIDGIPMNNFTGATENDFFNPSQDLGNGLGDLNPEDIESVSVLKGGAAAALYGSRAGNGVILITTKTGKTREGLGITFSATTGFQSIFLKPEIQNSYGQGTNGVFEDQSVSSWGPKIEGQSVEDWEGKQVALQAYDNLDHYYNGGFNQTYSISFQQQVNDATSVYSSVNFLNDDSNIPGATLERLNLLTRAVSKFGKKDNWTTDVKVQYTNLKAENRPLNGANISNPYRTVALLPRSLNIAEFEMHTDPSNNMRWYLDTNAVNPYWSIEKNLSEDSRDRFLLNGSLKYEMTDWLSAEIKAGADLYTTNTESKLYSGSPLSNTGRYSLGKNTFIEKNYSALLTASKNNIIGEFGGVLTLGGNLMSNRASGLSSNSGDLEVPNLFSLNNGINNATIEQIFSEKKINSLYGSLQLNYGGYFFIEATGRNDWSSTLSKANRSFFYPSISTSLVFTEMFNELPEWLNFSKIRASYASVGNDLDAYKLYNFYTIGSDPNNNTTATSGDVLFNSDVKNELIKSLEVGFEGRFFNSRLAIDFAWYKSNATNQLIELPLDPLSGFNSEIINAGDIQNEGYELGISGKILDNLKEFSWDVNLNYSTNKNTILELTDEVTKYRLGGFDNLSILAFRGGNYGEIWGTKYRRVEDPSDANFGKIIVDGDGLPLATEESFNLGNQQPDAMIGFSNTFTYKNISLGFLIDARLGGEIFSGTNLALQEIGNASATVVNGGREDILVDGVVDDGSGNFTTNTVAVSPENYWTAITGRSGNLGINEANIYDATNIRLRNVNLSYSLPSKWLEKIEIQKMTLGISANNVWMIKSHLNGVDPESVYATSTNATGFESLSSPTTRSIILNVSVSF